ncbi:MAG: YkgJ family cysteine cluster protein [Burkholderiaceae bacterium]
MSGRHDTDNPQGRPREPLVKGACVVCPMRPTVRQAQGTAATNRSLRGLRSESRIFLRRTAWRTSHPETNKVHAAGNCPQRLAATGWRGFMVSGGETCTRCGACCATYRVAFLRHELDSEADGWVPAAFTEAIGRRGACMRGTRTHPRRCVALRGLVGVDASCAIYAQRPSSCRAFAPDAGAGYGDAACADARRRYGLPPLAGSYDGFPIG